MTYIDENRRLFIYSRVVCKVLYALPFSTALWKQIQGVPQSQTTVIPRHQEEEETGKTKLAQIEQTYGIQIYLKFYHQKMKKKSNETSDILHISAQNIDCRYSLEPPQWGGSNGYQ